MARTRTTKQPGDPMVPIDGDALRRRLEQTSTTATSALATLRSDFGIERTNAWFSGLLSGKQRRVPLSNRRALGKILFQDEKWGQSLDAGEGPDDRAPLRRAVSRFNEVMIRRELNAPWLPTFLEYGLDPERWRRHLFPDGEPLGAADRFALHARLIETLTVLISSPAVTADDLTPERGIGWLQMLGVPDIEAIALIRTGRPAQTGPTVKRAKSAKGKG